MPPLFFSLSSLSLSSLSWPAGAAAPRHGPRARSSCIGRPRLRIELLKLGMEPQLMDLVPRSLCPELAHLPGLTTADAWPPEDGSAVAPELRRLRENPSWTLSPSRRRPHRAPWPWPPLLRVRGNHAVTPRSPPCQSSAVSRRPGPPPRPKTQPPSRAINNLHPRPWQQSCLCFVFSFYQTRARVWFIFIKTHFIS